MASRGKEETERLRRNINDQLNRLLQQLEDLEEFKSEFTLEEYNESKSETMSLLSEFQAFLAKTTAGDMTLIDEFNSVQLAIQAAISQAFQTPEVIRLFAKKQPTALRSRLAGLKRDLKIKHMKQARFDQQAVEILTALKKLGEKLTPEEESFLEEKSVGASFENAFDSLGANVQQNLLSAASAEIKAAEQ